jgi:hypothetical protein
MYSILEEADKLIDSTKREEYGSIEDSFQGIADIWAVILKRTVTRQEVALCMLGLKLYRESFKHKPDNLIDIVGYTKCLGHLNGITS